MKDRVKQIMAAVFETDVAKIDDNASPNTIGNWDSLRLINLVSALEEEFQIEFDEEDIIEMLNFELIVLKVSEKLK